MTKKSGVPRRTGQRPLLIDYVIWIPRGWQRGAGHAAVAAVGQCGDAGGRGDGGFGVARQIDVKTAYRLWLSAKEKRALTDVLARC